MRSFLRQFLLLTTLIFFTVGKANARPMGIAFNEMIEKAKTIVVAEFLGLISEDQIIPSEYFLKVEYVLKGKVTGDTLIVNRAHGAIHLPVGSRCVAFINEAGEFEWAGVVGEKGSLEKDILSLFGFYDFNAYFVYPSTLSMVQLKSYLQTKSYSGTVDGNLHFINIQTKKLEPSDIQFHIEYTYNNGKVSRKVKSENMTLIDFPKTPEIALTGWDNMISLHYEENMVRPLKINGDILDVAEDGTTFKGMFWVDAPDLLNEAEFKQYLSDPSLSLPYYELEIETEAGQKYTLMLNENYGRIGYIKDFYGQKISCSSLSPPENYDGGHLHFERAGEKLSIQFSERKTDKVLMEHTYEDFILHCMLEPLEGTMSFISLKHKDPIGPCKISYIRTGFNLNENFRNE